MNATQSSAAQILLFLVIIAWRLVRKMRERPAKTDARRWRLPLILTVAGGYETLSLTRGAHPVKFDTADIIYLAAAGAASVMLGLVRGSTVRLADRGGVLTEKYTALTAFLWVATVALRLGMDLTASRSFGVASAVTGTSILMMFGLSLLGEAAVVTLRAGAFRGTGSGVGTGVGTGTDSGMGRGSAGLGGGPRDAGPFDARPSGAGARRTR
jgi:hypothetical protein